MARPKSDAKREAILEAAIRIVGEQGLSASTAAMAKQAGVAQGSLFNYFPTKSDLLNAAYLRLKDELNDAVLAGLPDSADTRRQLHHLWTRWLHWGTSNVAHRRALAQLSVSDQITESSRAASFKRSTIGIGIVQRASAGGVLGHQPIDFVATIVDAIASATMDHMIRVPAQAETYRETAFDALWKALQ